MIFNFCPILGVFKAQKSVNVVVFVDIVAL